MQSEDMLIILAYHYYLDHHTIPNLESSFICSYIIFHDFAKIVDQKSLNWDDWTKIVISYLTKFWMYSNNDSYNISFVLTNPFLKRLQYNSIFVPFEDDHVVVKIHAMFKVNLVLLLESKDSTASMLIRCFSGFSQLNCFIIFVADRYLIRGCYKCAT